MIWKLYILYRKRPLLVAGSGQIPSSRGSRPVSHDPFLEVNGLFHGCVGSQPSENTDIHNMICNSRKLDNRSSNKYNFMVWGHHNMLTVLNGCSIWKVENHYPKI